MLHHADHHKPGFRVSARIRPFLPYESNRKSYTIRDGKELGLATTSGPRLSMHIGNQQVTKMDFMQFDSIFDSQSTNNDVFQSTAKPLCDRMIKTGTNTLFIALGPTGTGKTTTLLGDPARQQQHAAAHPPVLEQGVLGMAMDYLVHHPSRKVDHCTLKVLETVPDTPTTIAQIEGTQTRRITAETDIVPLLERLQSETEYVPKGQNPNSNRHHNTYIVEAVMTDGRCCDFVCLGLPVRDRGDGGRHSAVFQPNAFPQNQQESAPPTESALFGMEQILKCLEPNPSSKVSPVHLVMEQSPEFGPIFEKYLGAESTMQTHVLCTLSPSETNLQETKDIVGRLSGITHHKIWEEMVRTTKHKDEMIRDLKSQNREQAMKIAHLQQRASLYVSMEEHRTSISNPLQNATSNLMLTPNLPLKLEAVPEIQSIRNSLANIQSIRNSIQNAVPIHGAAAVPTSRVSMDYDVDDLNRDRQMLIEEKEAIQELLEWAVLREQRGDGDAEEQELLEEDLEDIDNQIADLDAKLQRMYSHTDSLRASQSQWNEKHLDAMKEVMESMPHISEMPEHEEAPHSDDTPLHQEMQENQGDSPKSSRRDSLVDSQYKSLMQTYEQQKALLKAENQDLRARCDIERIQRVEATKEHNEGLKALEALKQRYAALESAQKEQQQEREEYKSKMAKVLDHVLGENTDLKATIKTLEHDLVDMEEHDDAVSRQAHSLEVANKELQRQSEGIKSQNVSKASVEEMEGKMASLSFAKDKLQGQFDALQHEKEMMLNRVKALSSKNVALTAELEGFQNKQKSDAAILVDELNETSANEQRLRRDMEGMKSAMKLLKMEKAQLQENMAALSTKWEESLQTKAHLESGNVTLRKQNEELGRENARIQSELETVTSLRARHSEHDVEKQMLENLQEHLHNERALKMANKSLKEWNEELKKANGKLQTELDESERVRQGLEKATEYMTDSMKAESASKIALNNKIEELRESRNTHRAIKEEVQKRKANEQRLQCELANIRRDRKLLEEGTESLLALTTNLKDKNDALTLKLDESEIRCLDLGKSLDSMKSHAISKEDHDQRLISKVDGLQRENTRLEAKCDVLRIEAEEAQRSWQTISDQSMELDALKREYGDLKRALMSGTGGDNDMENIAGIIDHLAGNDKGNGKRNLEHQQQRDMDDVKRENEALSRRIDVLQSVGEAVQHRLHQVTEYNVTLSEKNTNLLSTISIMKQRENQRGKPTGSAHLETKAQNQTGSALLELFGDLEQNQSPNTNSKKTWSNVVKTRENEEKMRIEINVLRQRVETADEKRKSAEAQINVLVHEKHELLASHHQAQLALQTKEKVQMLNAQIADLREELKQSSMEKKTSIEFLKMKNVELIRTVSELEEKVQEFQMDPDQLVEWAQTVKQDNDELSQLVAQLEKERLHMLREDEKLRTQICRQVCLPKWSMFKS